MADTTLITGGAGYIGSHIVAAPRRPGEVASCFADPSRAQQLLGWGAERDLDAICADAWRWQVNRR